MTFVVNIGKYGGFYFYRGHTTRLCLGWIAFTSITEDIDILIQRLLK